MISFDTVLTHPGGAHKDEFLACSVLLAVRPAPIVRREPTADDLANAAVCVVDVGHEHAPALNNFDHHQLADDQPPTCSLSLVLQHLGLYEDARRFCEWLEPAEWFDCRGPAATARWLGVERDVLAKLNSPLDVTLLRRFSQATRLEPGQPLWEIMRMIGEDLITYVKNLRERLDFIGRHAETWEIASPAGPATIFFLPRTDPLPDDPAMGIERYLESAGLATRVMGLVYPDRRSAGYGLSRFRDHPGLDFTRLRTCPDVHFAHARGFVAKTSASEVTRLRELVAQARVPVS